MNRPIWDKPLWQIDYYAEILDLRQENQRLRGRVDLAENRYVELLYHYDYYKNSSERRGELLERILALDPLFPDDLLDEMRKELSDG